VVNIALRAVLCGSDLGFKHVHLIGIKPEGNLSILNIDLKCSNLVLLAIKSCNKPLYSAFICLSFRLLSNPLPSMLKNKYLAIIISFLYLYSINLKRSELCWRATH